jgi:hypothetical protein
MNAIDQQSIIEKNITLYLFASVSLYRCRTNRKVNEWRKKKKGKDAGTRDTNIVLF